VSSDYRWVAHQQAVEILLRLSPSNRGLVLEQLDGLVADPFAVSDAHVSDDDGRDLQIKIAGRFIITYWPDHAVKEVRVLAIETV
jgi:hypothetical protein